MHLGNILATLIFKVLNNYRGKCFIKLLVGSVFGRNIIDLLERCNNATFELFLGILFI